MAHLFLSRDSFGREFLEADGRAIAARCRDQPRLKVVLALENARLSPLIQQLMLALLPSLTSTRLPPRSPLSPTCPQL